MPMVSGGQREWNPMVSADCRREGIGAGRAWREAAGGLGLGGLLFGVWAVWAWWALLVTRVGTVWAYRQALRAAGVYGDLLRAAFNVHRTALYRALRWPLPGTPQEEHKLGQKLSDYLRRGSRAAWPPFTNDGEG